MKNFSFSFFLAFAMLTSLIVTGQDVAIGMKVNGGKPIGDGSCSTEEHSEIQTALLDAVEAVNRRNLRAASRQLDPFFCSIYCRGFAPGWCWIVYRECTDSRMLEEEESPGDLEVSLLEATAVRDLAAPTEFDEQCLEAKRAVVKAVKQELDWGSLAPSCKKVLREQVDLECLKV